MDNKNMKYYLYHIPGKKIGVTTDLHERVECQQGYGPEEYTVIMSTEDIELVCNETGLDMGSYYHFAHNLHIYSDKLNK